jgi:hypothetical protein
MNKRRARTLRKEVYGDDSLRNRRHFVHRNTGAVIADQKRQEYQGLKKAWNRLSRIKKRRMAKNERHNN